MNTSKEIKRSIEEGLNKINMDPIEWDSEFNSELNTHKTLCKFDDKVVGKIYDKIKEEIHKNKEKIQKMINDLRSGVTDKKNQENVAFF